MSEPIDSLDVTPSRVLEDALRNVSNDPEPANKALVILLKDEPDGEYLTQFYNAGMKCSEIVALLEVMKLRVLRQMVPHERPSRDDDGEEWKHS